MPHGGMDGPVKSNQEQSVPVGASLLEPFDVSHVHLSASCHRFSALAAAAAMVVFFLLFPTCRHHPTTNSLKCVRTSVSLVNPYSIFVNLLVLPLDHSICPPVHGRLSHSG